MLVEQMSVRRKPDAAAPLYSITLELVDVEPHDLGMLSLLAHGSKAFREMVSDAYLLESGRYSLTPSVSEAPLSTQPVTSVIAPPPAVDTPAIEPKAKRKKTAKERVIDVEKPSDIPEVPGVEIPKDFHVGVAKVVVREPEPKPTDVPRSSAAVNTFDKLYGASTGETRVGTERPEPTQPTQRWDAVDVPSPKQAPPNDDVDPETLRLRKIVEASILKSFPPRSGNGQHEPDPDEEGQAERAEAFDPETIEPEWPSSSKPEAPKPEKAVSVSTKVEPSNVASGGLPKGFKRVGEYSTEGPDGRRYFHRCDLPPDNDPWWELHVKANTALTFRETLDDTCPKSWEDEITATNPGAKVLRLHPEDVRYYPEPPARALQTPQRYKQPEIRKANGRFSTLVNTLCDDAEHRRIPTERQIDVITAWIEDMATWKGPDGDYIYAYLRGMVNIRPQVKNAWDISAFRACIPPDQYRGLTAAWLEKRRVRPDPSVLAKK